MSKCLRLGVFIDILYMRSGDVVSTDNPMARLLIALAQELGHLTVIGRVQDGADTSAIEIDRELVTFVEIPNYGSLHNVINVMRTCPQILSVIDRTLPSLDAIWLFGPHPLASFVARRARRRKVAVFLAVGSEFREYVKGRFSGVSVPFARVAGAILEWAFHRLSVRSPTVVVGQQLARKWHASAVSILNTQFGLLRADEVVDPEAAGAYEWRDPVELLAVTRLSPEKNPQLLVDVMRELGPGWHLRIAGDGELYAPMHALIRRRALEESVELLGNIRFGGDLFDLYRSADCLVHVSNTEGAPQVLLEAMSFGVPIVATNVGGVSAVLQQGGAGGLVPPRNAAAVAAALVELRANPALRRQRAIKGAYLAREFTLERNVSGIVAFMMHSLPGERPRLLNGVG